MTAETMNYGEGRRWTRRTRILLPTEPKEIFGPEKIEAIKKRGDELLTPRQALGEMGIKIREDEETEKILNSMVMSASSPNLFEHSDEKTVFQAKKIEEFIEAARDTGPNLALLADLPHTKIEEIFKTAPTMFSFEALKKRVSELAKAEKKRKAAIKTDQDKRSSDWGK